MNAGQIISAVLSALAVIVSIAAIIRNGSRADTQESKEDGLDKGIILTKLDSIEETVRDIKQDMREDKAERRELRDKVTTLEQKVKALEKSVFNS